MSACRKRSFRWLAYTASALAGVSPAHAQPATASRAALPYTGTLNASVGDQVGSSETLFWRTEWGGAPLTYATGTSGAYVVRCYRLTAGDRAMVAQASGKLVTTDADRAAVAKAGWRCPWVQYPEQLSGDYSVSRTLLPGSDPSDWPAEWAIAAYPPGRATLWEIDYAEVTRRADGKMIWRQQAHGRDPKTGRWTLPAAGCPSIFPAGETHRPGYRIRGQSLTFTMDGRDTCTIAIPAGFNVPVTLVDDVARGGLASPTTAATPPAFAIFGPVKVTRP